MKTTVIIIGAGVAGLATAGLLARNGYQVTVVEKNATFGGRAGNLEAKGFRWDTGPSWYLMPDAFERFFQQMGTSTKEVLDVVRLSEPAYRIFPEHHLPLDIPAGRENVVKLFESIEQGAGKQLEAYLDSAEFAYRTALDHFLYTTFSSPLVFLRRDILTNLAFLISLLTTSLDKHVAKRFTDTRLRQVLAYPAVFLSSRPEKTPALYHLMSHTDLTQGVSYPIGGFHAVTKVLYKLALDNGVTFRFSSPVSSITTSDGRATGIALSEERLQADVVVSCADLHHTETQLLPETLRSYSENWFDKRSPGLGTVLLMLGISGELPQLAHHNLFFSENWTVDFDAVFEGTGWSQSIYVSKPSATDPEVAPAGHENLFVLVPVKADPAFEREEEVAEDALRLISERAEIPDLASRIVFQHILGPADFARDYHAWSGGSIGPSHSLKQSAFLRGSNKSKKIAGLYYAGATTVPGVGVPLCLISAENVLIRLREE